MAATIYYNARHFGESFQRMNDLRESKETCDIRLLASNKEFLAHKLVLASASEYFKNSIYGLFLNNFGKNELELKEIQHEILSELLNYMYTGEIEINSENVYDIYNAADFYLMNFVKELCLDFLNDNIDINNCVKIWVMANNFKHEKILIDAGNFIISNLELASKTKHFLSLSNEEVSDIFKLWPEDELCDSFINSLLIWAADKDDWEETVINILKDIPHTRIGENYLKNILSKNDKFKNNISCKKWMADIYEDKLKSINEKKIKLEQASFSRFLYHKPIICLEMSDLPTLYKFNRRWVSCSVSNRLPGYAFDCATYKNWIYSVAYNECGRYRYQNEYAISFQHTHGRNTSIAVLNDSIYICGGSTSTKKWSGTDLNTTKVVTNCSLLYDRERAGVAVNDGVTYICGGDYTDIVERFDPREGRTTHFGSIPFNRGNGFCSVATFSNQIHCIVNNDYKIMDIRNNSKCVQSEIPGSRKSYNYICLLSSYGKLCIINEGAVFESSDGYEPWDCVGWFSHLAKVDRAISFG